MKKTLSIMLMMACFVGQLIASPVDVNTARQLGLKYVQANATKQVTGLSLAYTQTTESGANALYVFNFEGGYMIMAADDVALPILAYGEEGNFLGTTCLGLWRGRQLRRYSDFGWIGLLSALLCPPD